MTYDPGDLEIGAEEENLEIAVSENIGLEEEIS